MALEDFLGETSELKIIDFLAENMDNSYNQTEISEFTRLSRTTVNKKIPEMIHNNILEIKKELGPLKTYQLADNDIVKMLISASLLHSFKQAENPLEEEEAKEILQRMIGYPSIREPNRYYIKPVSDGVIMSFRKSKSEMISTHGIISPVLISA
jgi:hypothetical protein